MCIFANNYAHDSVGNVRGHLQETLMYPGAYFSVLHTQLESYYTEYQEFEDTNMRRLKDRQLGENIQVIHILLNLVCILAIFSGNSRRCF